MDELEKASEILASDALPTTGRLNMGTIEHPDMESPEQPRGEGIPMDESIAYENEAMAINADLSSDSRPVRIERLNSGFLVTVGCQKVAVESTKKLTTMLGKYYEDPRDFEKKWFSKNVVNRLDNIN